MPSSFPPRRYLSFPELLARWGCEERDILEAVVTRVLVPSMFIDAVLIQGWWDQSFDPTTGSLIPEFMAEAGPCPVKRVRKYLYLRHAHETGPGACLFGTFCDSATARPFDPGPVWFEPHRPVTLAEVVDSGVFMQSEIARFECTNSWATTGAVGGVTMIDDEQDRGATRQIGLAIRCASSTLGFEPKLQPVEATGQIEQQVKPLQRQRAQEQAILSTLTRLGFDPQALPPPPSGKKSVAKQAVKAAMGYTPDVMEKAWQRLRNDERIKDA